MRKILILEPFRDSELEKIEQSITDDFSMKVLPGDATTEQLREELKDAEVVVGQPPLLLIRNPEQDCPKLKLIQMTWAGTDIYTRSRMPFPKEQISLANASGTYGMIMSQFVIGMTLSLMFNFMDYHTQQQNEVWERRGPILSLDGARVLIFGAGDIGTAVAKRLSGFNAHCIGVCRNTDKEREYFHELCTLEEAEKYLPCVDVVVGCIPNTEETAGYLSRQRLMMLKKTAIIVNVGRGNFIDCMALDEIIRDGHIWGAALDVTFPEPLPAGHPLWSNPKCMITPHTSGATFGQIDATEELLCGIVCDNLSRYCSGTEIRNRIY